MAMQWNVHVCADLATSTRVGSKPALNRARSLRLYAVADFDPVILDLAR